MTTLTPTPTRPTRLTPDMAITQEGVVQLAPTEFHAHSVWRTLRLDNGALVRCIIAFDSALARWVAPGHRIKITGLVRPKVWQDGIVATISAHDRLEILYMPTSPAVEE